MSIKKVIKSRPGLPPPTVDVKRRRRPKLNERRIRTRDRHWPDAADRIWSRTENDGFSTIPRLLPLILVLVKSLSKSGDPTSPYMDLWARVFDEGLIEVKNPGEFAYSSGYQGKRAVRTWTERMRELKSLGFIDYKPRAGSEIGYVLLINPLKRAVELKAENKVPDEWWDAFIERAEEVGAEVDSV